MDLHTKRLTSLMFCFQLSSFCNNTHFTDANLEQCSIHSLELSNNFVLLYNKFCFKERIETKNINLLDHHWYKRIMNDNWGNCSGYYTSSMCYHGYAIGLAKGPFDPPGPWGEGWHSQIDRFLPCFSEVRLLQHPGN